MWPSQRRKAKIESNNGWINKQTKPIECPRHFFFSLSLSLAFLFFSSPLLFLCRSFSTQESSDSSDKIAQLSLGKSNRDLFSVWFVETNPNVSEAEEEFLRYSALQNSLSRLRCTSASTPSRTSALGWWRWTTNQLLLEAFHRIQLSIGLDWRFRSAHAHTLLMTALLGRWLHKRRSPSTRHADIVTQKICFFIMIQHTVYEHSSI